MEPTSTLCPGETGRLEEWSSSLKRSSIFNSVFCSSWSNWRPGKEAATCSAKGPRRIGLKPLQTLFWWRRKKIECIHKSGIFTQHLLCNLQKHQHTTKYAEYPLKTPTAQQWCCQPVSFPTARSHSWLNISTVGWIWSLHRPQGEENHWVWWSPAPTPLKIHDRLLDRL